jgi:hypothetical protein
MMVPRSIPFTTQQLGPVYNGIHSIGVGERVQRLYIGCFSNMNQTGALSDDSNTAANLLGGANQ